MSSLAFQPRRLLIRGVNWLGDAVMTTPALLRLRQALPEAHLTLLTPAKLADLWLHHPALDGVIPVEKGEAVWQVARRLRRGDFDAALIFPNSPRSALEIWLAGIPERIGAVRPWRNWLLTRHVKPRAQSHLMRKRPTGEIRLLTREPARRQSFPSPVSFSAAAAEIPRTRGQGLDTGSPNRPEHREVFPPEAHQIYHYLSLVAALGAHPDPMPPLLEVRPVEVEAVCQKFSGLGSLASPGPLFGLNAGAEYGPAKRWPKDRFIAAAIELQRRTRCRWWVFGGQNDLELAREITLAVQQANPEHAAVVRSLAGQTTLRELCAALRACAVVLTNDTGPMHVAAAVGRPVVVPFGSTAPELTGPGLPGDRSHRLLLPHAACAPCFQRQCPIDFRCMDSISVAQVVSAVLEAWRKTPSP